MKTCFNWTQEILLIEWRNDKQVHSIIHWNDPHNYLVWINFPWLHYMAAGLCLVNSARFFKSWQFIFKNGNHVEIAYCLHDIHKLVLHCVKVWVDNLQIMVWWVPHWGAWISWCCEELQFIPKHSRYKRLLSQIQKPHEICLWTKIN